MLAQLLKCVETASTKRGSSGTILGRFRVSGFISVQSKGNRSRVVHRFTTLIFTLRAFAILSMLICEPRKPKP